MKAEAPLLKDDGTLEVTGWKQVPYHPWDERYIYLHAWMVDLFMGNVGKYTSPMDAMGVGMTVTLKM